MSDRHQTKPYPLRIGEDLRKRLEEAAADAGRSLNSEIAERLESSFTRNDFSWLMNNRIDEYEALMQRRQEILKEMNDLQLTAHEFATGKRDEDERHLALTQALLARLHEERALLAKIAAAVSEGFNVLLALGAESGTIKDFGSEKAAKSNKPTAKR